MLTQVCIVFRAIFVSCIIFFIWVINSKVIAWAVSLKTSSITPCITMYLYRVFSKWRRSFQHVMVYVVLKNFSQNHLSKMCTAMKIQFFFNKLTDMLQNVWAILSECSCGVKGVRRVITRKTPSWAT
jgi:hypothetical protein